MDDESASRGFKVEDRRRFSSSGEARDSTPENETKPQPEPSTASVEEPHEGAFAEMSFSVFVIGLCTQALVHLGEMPDPSSQGLRGDLPAAKQLIDILGILQTKTRGNLDESESRLLESALYDLRMKYVERSRPK